MKAQLISAQALEALQIAAETLEQDGRGIKVSLLPDGNVLKVFRLRRRWSSGLLISNATRFAKNVERLKAKGIPTVHMLRMYQVASTTMTAVEYQPIPGETIRNLLKAGSLTDMHFEQLGRFVAHLHRLGIYFRSLHLGNIVMMPTGEMGLIDVADMRIYPWRLHFHTCFRNFKRICRYAEDMQRISQNQKRLIVDAYMEASGRDIRQGHQLHVLMLASNIS